MFFITMPSAERSRPRDGFEDECGGPRKTAASPPE